MELFLARVKREEARSRLINSSAQCRLVCLALLGWNRHDLPSSLDKRACCRSSPSKTKIDTQKRGEPIRVAIRAGAGADGIELHGYAPVGEEACCPLIDTKPA